MVSTYVYLALQVVAVAIIHRAITNQFVHPLRNYPGPFLASISNLWKLYHYLIGSLHVVEQNLHKQYGPIVRTGPDSLSFSSPEAFDAIYGFNQNFEKGDFYVFARDPFTGVSNIFSSRSHLEHRDCRRKVLGAALTSTHIRSYSPVVTKNVQRFINKLSDSIEGAKDNVLNVAEPIHAFTLDNILEIIFGPSITPDGRPWTETANAEGVLAAFSAISKFGWGASYVPLLARIMSTKFISRFNRKATFKKDGTPTGLGALRTRALHLLIEEPDLITAADQPSIAKNMLVVDKDDSRYMEPKQLFSECFNLLFAGPGSTAAALTGVLERLGTEVGLTWQKRIRDELMEVGDVNESKTLDAVVRESMRYSAPFPSAFPRDVRPGAENAIPGLSEPLPVGTIVASNSWIVSHDQGSWGSDAGQWKPERWLNVKDAAERKAMDSKFVVFSKGPRGCIGKDIATLVIMQTVAGILSNWEIETVGELVGGAWLEMQVEKCELKFTKI